MVEYSVDTNPRLRIYFGAAIISALLAWSVSIIPSMNAIRFAAPPAFLIFGCVMWIFDRLLWRLPIVRALSGIPYLAGFWAGTIKLTKLTNDPPHVLQIGCYITQTWRKIDIIFESEKTISTTKVVGLFVENPEHIVVKYIYSVRPKTLLQSENLSGEGVSELRLLKRDGSDHLEGLSYSEKLRRGDIQLRRLTEAEKLALAAPQKKEPLNSTQGSSSA
jgi:hypothetical protein